VIDMEFQNVDAHSAMARVLTDPAVDEYEKAIGELETLSVLNPVGKWEHQRVIGDLYANAGEAELARKTWYGVAEQSASEPNLFCQLAMRLFRVGDLSRSLELVGLACAISPAEFRYRVTHGHLLTRAALGGRSVERFGQTLSELSSALKLAEAAPELAGYVEPLWRSIVQARTELARQRFTNGEFAAAQKEFEEVSRLLKSKPRSADSPPALDAEVQIVRCQEALGVAKEAAARYRAILEKKPEAACWVSRKVTVPGSTFVALKQAGELPEERAQAQETATGAMSILGTAGEPLALSGAVRAAELAPDGTLFVEGEDFCHHVDALRHKLLSSSPRAKDAAADRAMTVPTGAGRLACLQDGRIWTQELASRKVLWTVDESAKGRGYWRSLAASERFVLVSGATEVQMLSAADGRSLWRRPVRLPVSDMTDDAVVVINTAAGGGKEFLALSCESGAALGTCTLSSSVAWQHPVLSGGLVLLTDSLTGTISGLDLQGCRPRFLCKLDVTPIASPRIFNQVAYVHYLQDGNLHVAALDLRRLRTRFEVQLQPDSADTASTSPQPAQPKAVKRTASQSGINVNALPPLAWRHWLLHFDSRSSAVLALDCRSGKVSTVAPQAAAGSVQIAKWVLVNDTVCLVGTQGQLQFIELSEK
jgi:tetratricopeptide (TPR) repeat protein